MTGAELLTAAQLTGLTTDTGDQQDELLCTPRDRADVTMTSEELHALLTE